MDFVVIEGILWKNISETFTAVAFIIKLLYYYDKNSDDNVVDNLNYAIDITEKGTAVRL